MAEKTYKIGEAARILNLKGFVLRFWETEFKQLCPLRTEKGQRLYTEADLTLLKRIRHLLHEQGLTIEGAKRVLAGAGSVAPGSLLDYASGSGVKKSALAASADFDEGESDDDWSKDEALSDLSDSFAAEAEAIAGEFGGEPLGRAAFNSRPFGANLAGTTSFDGAGAGSSAPSPADAVGTSLAANGGADNAGVLDEDGLSAAMLEKGYSEFVAGSRADTEYIIASKTIPPDFKAGSASLQAERDTAQKTAEKLQAALHTRNALLRETIGELQELRALLAEQDKYAAEKISKINSAGASSAQSFIKIGKS